MGMFLSFFSALNELENPFSPRKIEQILTILALDVYWEPLQKPSLVEDPLVNLVPGKASFLHRLLPEFRSDRALQLVEQVPERAPLPVFLHRLLALVGIHTSRFARPVKHHMTQTLTNRSFFSGTNTMRVLEALSVLACTWRRFRLTVKLKKAIRWQVTMYLSSKS